MQTVPTAPQINVLTYKRERANKSYSLGRWANQWNYSIFYGIKLNYSFYFLLAREPMPREYIRGFSFLLWARTGHLCCQLRANASTRNHAAIWLFGMEHMQLNSSTVKYRYGIDTNSQHHSDSGALACCLSYLVVQYKCCPYLLLVNYLLSDKVPLPTLCRVQSVHVTERRRA